MSEVRFGQCDFHTHTELSGEAQASGFTLQKLFETADRLDMRCVGYSEHWHRATPASLFVGIREELGRLQPRYKTRVYLSAEIDVLNSRGELAVDPVAALEILDYVSVAISHYGIHGFEQLERDRVDDTVAMIRSVIRIPEVTMLMHPQIVYGRSVGEIDRVIGGDIYGDLAREIAANGKVIDYASIEMSEKYLVKLGYRPERLAMVEESFDNYSKALVEQDVRLAPGSDAHNILYWDSSGPWFGNNSRSWQLLRSLRFTENHLWTGPGS